jgi:hypothetical protein
MGGRAGSGLVPQNPATPDFQTDSERAHLRRCTPRPQGLTQGMAFSRHLSHLSALAFWRWPQAG